jgi:hypothetical protein
MYPDYSFLERVMKVFVWLGFIILLNASTASAQIYKWIDEHGKTQYTDRPPPPDVKAEGKRLNIKSSPVTGGHGPTKDVSDQREEFDKRRQERREEDAKLQAKSEENKKKCIEAQTQLRMYADSPRLTIPDGAGGVVYVDDDLRQRKIDDANKAIKKYCK